LTPTSLPTSQPQSRYWRRSPRPPNLQLSPSLEKRREETETETENLRPEENKDHLEVRPLGPGDLQLGDDGYPELVLADAVLNGHITQAEAESRYELHKLVER
jgi:hypothetical protein